MKEMISNRMCWRLLRRLGLDKSRSWIGDSGTSRREGATCCSFDGTSSSPLAPVPRSVEREGSSHSRIGRTAKDGEATPRIRVAAMAKNTMRLMELLPTKPNPYPTGTPGTALCN